MMRTTIILVLLLMVAGCTSDSEDKATEAMEQATDYQVTMVNDVIGRVLVEFDVPDGSTEDILQHMAEITCDVQADYPDYDIRFGGKNAAGVTLVTGTLPAGVDCDGMRWGDFSEYSIADGLR